MQQPRFLLPLLVPLAASAAVGLWACTNDDTPGTPVDNGNSAGGAGGAGGAGSAGGAGGILNTGGAASTVSCTLDNGSDPVDLCTQKLVLRTERAVAYDMTRGLAESWSSTTSALDMGASSMVLHDPRDDASFSAAVTRYVQSANTYGDAEITLSIQADFIHLAPTLAAELTPPPAGYAGELYLDLRTAAGGLRTANRGDLADPIDAIADTYGRAIYTTYFVPLQGGDAGATDAVLGTPAAGDSGSGTAYAPGDMATGAYALADLAVRHATDDPTDSALWQAAAAAVFAHLDARARDPQTGLYFAALVTSADPGHDALAPADPAGPPADALLTDVAARIALALIRTQTLVTGSPAALPALAAVPLEARAEALLAALDATPQSLWDVAGGPPAPAVDGGTSDGGTGTLGGGYFAGWVPSTGQLLTDKPTRANALLMAALHRAVVMGNGPDPGRVGPLRALFSGVILPAAPFLPNTAFINVVPNQNGYFQQVPSGFDFAGVDAGADPRAKSYFSSANADVIEGLSELWVGIPH